MKIHGVSQTTGAERSIELTPTPSGVLFVFSDSMGHTNERIVITPEPFITVLTDHPEGAQTIIGTSRKVARWIKVEVRKNEVLLTLGRMDAAVGLDDLMDALAAIPAV
jgi:hypothetical protein